MNSDREVRSGFIIKSLTMTNKRTKITYDLSKFHLELTPTDENRAGVFCTVNVIGEHYEWYIGDRKNKLAWNTWHDWWYGDAISKDREGNPLNFSMPFNTGDDVVVELKAWRMLHQPTFSEKYIKIFDNVNKLETKLISGKIANVWKENVASVSSVTITLGVRIDVQWDTVNFAPAGTVYKLLPSSYRTLLKDSNVQIKYQNMLNALLANADSGKSSGKINIPKLLAIALDNAGNILTEESISKGAKSLGKEGKFSSLLDVKNVPMLRVDSEDGAAFYGIAMYLISSLSQDILSYDLKTLFLAALQDFFMMAVPRYDTEKNDGTWTTAVIPNNIFANPVTMNFDLGGIEVNLLCSDMVLALTHSKTQMLGRDNFLVGIRYSVASGTGTQGTELGTQVALFGEAKNKKGELVLLSNTKDGVVYDTNNKPVSALNDIVINDLPAWLRYTTTPAGERPKTSEQREKTWAELLAKCMYMTRGRRHRGISVVIPAAYFTYCFNLVGKVIGISNKPSEEFKGIKWLWNTFRGNFKDKSTLIGRVAKVQFTIDATNNGFKSALQLDLEGVRDMEEQKTLVINSEDIFDMSNVKM